MAHGVVDNVLQLFLHDDVLSQLQVDAVQFVWKTTLHAISDVCHII